MQLKDEEARKLAEVHYQIEPGITRIYRILRDAGAELHPDEPIKLLEVSETTIPTGIMPLHFRPAPAQGIHFTTIIVEVTPEEFDKIQKQQLQLPPGWTVGDLLPQPGGNGDS